VLYSHSLLHREIGIRIAIGARCGDIVRRVIAEGLAMVAIDAVAGLAIGMASVQCIQSLLYQARLTDLSILGLPSLTILTTAMLASLPAVIRAVRTDLLKMLRTE
jgi:ABC-type antimicrobial peptide transport system permease subunit